MRPVVAGLLLTGMTSVPLLLAAGTAQAAACGPATVAGTPCTLTGTLTLGAGTLTLTSPTSLTWTGTANGLDQNLVDTTAAHQQYTVVDATGSAAGWHVTASATTFTTGGSSASTLPNSGTFSTDGSTSSISSANKPTATCSTGSTCFLPNNTSSYPVAITTAATTPTASTIYDTAALSGLGSIIIGGSAAANPVGWWLNVPANTLAGTYTSTITLQIISGP